MTAKLDPSELDIPPPEAKPILEKIKVDVGVSIQSDDNSFVITGTLNQINECHRLVKKYLNEDKTISSQLGKLSVVAEGQTSVQAVETRGATTAGTICETSGVIIATRIDEIHEAKVIPVNNKTEELEGSAHPYEPVKTFQIDPLALRFMNQFFNGKLQEISEECLVEVSTSTDSTQVILQAKQYCDPTRYNNACTELSILIETVTQGMATWEMDLKGADEGSVNALMAYIENKYPVILDQPHEHGPCVVYGDAASVREVRRTVERGMSQQESYDAATGAQGMAMAAPEAVSIETYSYRTENGVNISLRYGDITSEEVDAVVNPANDFLSHGAGLAKVIVQKGGSEIQSESGKLIQKRGYQSLHIGDAVHTRAGNLPCKFVIHAVGPTWGKNSYRESIKLLQKACFQSLKLASKLGLSSIAIPAISSGIFGTPADVCAFAMLNAVQEYLTMPREPKGTIDKQGNQEPGKKKKPSKTPKEALSQTAEGEKDKANSRAILNDIRFVLIDADTMDVFEKEFIERFGGGQKDITDDVDDVDDDDDEV